MSGIVIGAAELERRIARRVSRDYHTGGLDTVHTCNNSNSNNIMFMVGNGDMLARLFVYNNTTMHASNNHYSAVGKYVLITLL